jgi:hypothetical protein
LPQVDLLLHAFHQYVHMPHILPYFCRKEIAVDEEYCVDGAQAAPSLEAAAACSFTNNFSLRHL